MVAPCLGSSQMKIVTRYNNLNVKLPKFLSGNLVLKITSLNAVVITVRLIISIFIQRLLAVTVGEAGIATIGQVRNLIGMITSTSTLGTFSGVVKYVAEFKDDHRELTKLFSTTGLYLIIGSSITSLILFVGANQFSIYFFSSEAYRYVFKILAAVVPFIAVNRTFNAIVNGFTEYKKYAKIELISYLISSVALLLGLFYYELDGVIIAIVLAPVIQLCIVLLVFFKRLSQIVDLTNLNLSWVYGNKLMAFTLMSFVSTFLLNFVELDIRTLIAGELNVNEAGYWTAVNFISKNYMVFASGLFTLYVLPRFSRIDNSEDFKNELIQIYKTILPIFALGMIVVYLTRNLIISIIYPDFLGMEPLFKWQLLGDFVRLGALVLAHQFIAKRLVKSFIITEIVSLGLFYFLTKYFIDQFGTEGVVIAHFVRYIIYFVVVVAFVIAYYNRNPKKK